MTTFDRSAGGSRPRGLVLAAGLALGCLLLAACGGAAARNPSRNGTDEKLPPLGSAPLLERTSRQFEQDLAGQKGKVVVVNFWASWCVPCRAEMPALQQVSKEYAGKPVIFVGVDSSDVREEAEKLLRQTKVTYPTIYDRKGTTGGIASDWSVASLPQTWFVARDGTRALRVPRPLNPDELHRRIDQLLAAP